MNYRAVASAIAAAIAFSRPIAFIAQETGRAAGQMQIQSDVEVLLDLLRGLAERRWREIPVQDAPRDGRQDERRVVRHQSDSQPED
jgi:hypothetical protein